MTNQSQINSKIKDDFQVVLLLSCFMGHPVLHELYLNYNNDSQGKFTKNGLLIFLN